MKYEITEEQLKAICIEIELNQNSAINWIKEWFPEAFKTVLEVGRWYKRPHNKALFCIVGDPENEPFEIYGFDNDGDWMGYKKAQTFKDGEVEATEVEVFEALKNEAVKRGFVLGSLITPLYDEKNDKDNIFKVGSSFVIEKGKLYVRGYGKFCVLKDGKWAEIIPTITK